MKFPYVIGLRKTSTFSENIAQHSIFLDSRRTKHLRRFLRYETKAFSFLFVLDLVVIYITTNILPFILQTYFHKQIILFLISGVEDSPTFLKTDWFFSEKYQASLKSYHTHHRSQIFEKEDS